MFSEAVIKELKYYVYRLIDPRNGQTFYVGKGNRNRVFAHVNDDLDKDSDELSNKLKRIREIRNSGVGEVAHIIHRHGLDEDTAFEVEAALIDAYPEVLNANNGIGAGERGAMHVKQINEQYDAEEIEFKHKVIMFNVNQSALEIRSLYEAVRYAWRLDVKRADEADYVLALKHGVVIGVFEPTKWFKVSSESEDGMGGRIAFEGEEAPKEIEKIYLRKRLPDSMRKKGMANPVKYSYG